MSVIDTSFNQIAKGYMITSTGTGIDRRLVLTKNEMKGDPEGTGAYTDYVPRWVTTNTLTLVTSIKKIPMPGATITIEGINYLTGPYFAICEDDLQLYIYSTSNPLSAETGYFRKATGPSGVQVTFTSSGTTIAEV